MASNRLTESLGALCIISWGGDEKPLADSIANQMKHKPLIFPELISLSKSAALMKQARLFIGSDSAPLHLANLVDTQVIGLYGPKNSIIYGPFDAGQVAKPVIVRKDLPCSPCRKRTCSKPICMESITVEEVLQQAVQLCSERKNGKT